MSELRLSYPACMLVDKAEITPADVSMLQQSYAKGLVRRHDLPTLLAIEHARSRKCAEWDSFFVHTLAKHIAGVVDASDGSGTGALDWIKRVFTRGGVIGSRNEFAAIVEAVEILGRRAPELAVFALEQLCLAIAEGEGPLANSRNRLWVSLGREQLASINRLRAALGHRKALTAAEAEALFDPAQRLFNDRQETAWNQLVQTLTRPASAVA